MVLKRGILSVAFGIVVMARVVSNSQEVEAKKGAEATQQKQPLKGGESTTTTSTQASPTTTQTTTKTATAKNPLKGQIGALNGKPPVPQKKAWEDFPLNPHTTISLDFTEANPNAIFTLLAKASGLTILKDPNFKQKLTVATGKLVDLKTAFEIVNSVLGYSGYEFHKRGDILFVEKIPPPRQPAPQQQPPQPDTTPFAKVYRLQNASSLQVAKIVNDVYGASSTSGASPAPSAFPQGISFQSISPGQSITTMSGGAPGGGSGGPGAVKATADEYGNAVVVFTTPQKQPIIEAFIKELDKPADQLLETKIYRLKHVSAQDALPAVKQFLISLTPLGRGARQETPSNRSQFFFGSASPDPTQGSQTVVGIAQTNSLMVTATKANLAALDKVMDNLDQESTFIGNATVIELHNAKATDVATLLNNVFKQTNNNNNSNPFFFFFGDSSDQKKEPTTDVDEHGNVVNIRDLSGKVTVNADPNTNSIVVTTQPSYMPIVRHIVDQLDMEPQQVFIETIIVEATLDKTTKLGAEWNFLQNKVFGNSTIKANGGTNFGVQPVAGQTPQQGASYTVHGADYNAFINALQTETRFKILSTPHVVVSNNVKAEINEGQKVPYVVSQQTNGSGNTFFNYQFLDVGIVLDVTPRITSGNKVTLDVTQTANELQNFTSFNAPVINNRSANTTLSVDDGDTIILGGIIRTQKSVTENKVPILGDLPILGNLFRSKSDENQQVELMIFLTPHIIRNRADAQRITDGKINDLSGGSQKGVHEIIDKGKKNDH